MARTPGAGRDGSRAGSVLPRGHLHGRAPTKVARCSRRKAPRRGRSESLSLRRKAGSSLAKAQVPILSTRLSQATSACFANELATFLKTLSLVLAITYRINRCYPENTTQAILWRSPACRSIVELPAGGPIRPLRY